MISQPERISAVTRYHDELHRTDVLLESLPPLDGDDDVLEDTLPGEEYPSSPDALPTVRFEGS